jgi:hypothetical protein
VAGEGSSARVVTALSASPTAGLLRVYSEARQGDAATFETTVVDTTADQVAAQTAALAGSGYIITAFGEVGGTGEVILVGTRGSASYATTVQTSTDYEFAPTGSGSGAVVGWMMEVDDGSGSGSGTATFASTLVLED